MRRKTSTIFLSLIIFILSVGITAHGKSPKKNVSYLGGIKARMIGPATMSGRITSIDVDLSNPRVIYVGSAGGGIWKSQDGGVTFSPIFAKYTMSIGDLTIHQKDPKIIWVGTGECNVRNTVSIGDGIYVSHDSGKSWKHKGLKETERISQVIIHPDNPKIVYAAALGHLWNANKERGIYMTEDGGKSWKKILYVNENTGCADLDMDPQDPNIMYAAMWQFRRRPWTFTSGGAGSNLYKTTDAGKSWRIIRKGLPKGNLGRIGIAIAPSRTSVIYATVEAKENGLYRSDDLGESWKKVNESLSVRLRPFYFSKLTVDPNDHKTAYFGNLFLGYTQNGGESISDLLPPKYHPDVHQIWVDPKNSDHILLGTDGGVYETWNAFATISMINTLPVSQFYHVSYDMASPYNVYGGLQDNGSWFGPSALKGQAIRNKHWNGIGGGDGYYALTHPKEPHIIFYSSQGGWIYRQNRKTHETKDIQPLSRISNLNFPKI